MVFTGQKPMETRFSARERWSSACSTSDISQYKLHYLLIPVEADIAFLLGTAIQPSCYSKGLVQGRDMQTLMVPLN